MKNVELKNFMTGTWNVRTLYRPGHLTTAILEQNDINWILFHSKSEVAERRKLKNWELDGIP